MIGRRLRGWAGAVAAVAGLVGVGPAAAAELFLDGTIFISGGGASPSGRCAPALTIFNQNVTSTHSSLGSFVFDASECIASPPPTTTYDGLFSFGFADGTLTGTTYSVLSESGTPGLFQIDGVFVVTDGTGAFAGASGELLKRGLLDRRAFPPDATAVIGFVGSVSVVPEPASHGLMLAGLVAVGVLARRRRAG